MHRPSPLLVLVGGCGRRLDMAGLHASGGARYEPQPAGLMGGHIAGLESIPMSAKFLRLVLALALALAVPLQGFAAVAGGICMANGHHDGASHSHDGDSGKHPHEHDSEQAPASSAHCPPCVACCAAAAISSPAPLVIADTGTDTVSPATPASFAGIQLDTLDRPPLAL